MKILSLGNSFSTDATAYLYGLATAAGKEVRTVNLAVAGCSLERHMQGVREHAAPYELYVNGEATRSEVSFHEILSRDTWDVITLQQASRFGTDPSTFEPFLSELLEHIRAYSPDSAVWFHQTWPYREGTEKLAAAGFSSSRDMNDALRAAARAAAGGHSLPLIPAGEAVLLAAEKGIEGLYRDEFHLSYGAGRYLAACVWLETLFDVTASGNPFSDTAVLLTQQERESLAICAHEAVQRFGR